MRILIVKTSSLGDIVHAFSALAWLRQQFPEAQIDWVVEQPFAELVEAHPAVNRVIQVQTKKWRRSLVYRSTWRELAVFKQQLQSQTYDVIFDLQGNTKSGLITKTAKAKDKVGFSLKNSFEWPNRLFITHAYAIPKENNVREETLFLVKNYFKEKAKAEELVIDLKMSNSQQVQFNSFWEKLSSFPRPYVMVCPGSAWPNKQMTDEALIVFLKLLQRRDPCTYLFIYGNESERLGAEKLQREFTGHALVVDKLPLPALQNVMSRIDLVIAMDSLPLHLAGITQVPTFSIFGASLAAKYQPLGPQHRSFQGPCPYGQSFDRRCPKLRTCQTGACIRSLTGHEVFDFFVNRN